VFDFSLQKCVLFIYYLFILVYWVCMYINYIMLSLIYLIDCIIVD